MVTELSHITATRPIARFRQAPMPRVSPLWPRRVGQIISVALGLLVFGAVVFRDFVFGNATLLYKDLGSDTLNGYYPVVFHFSQYLREYGIPLWSFSTGLGQNVFLYIGF